MARWQGALLATLGLWVLSAGAEGMPVFASRCLQAKAGGGAVRIMHFGDSHLAAPSARQHYLRAFQSQFGDGGPGLGLPWTEPRNELGATASRGWRRALHPKGDSALGLGARFMEARHTGEWARLGGRFSRLRLHFLRLPGGGTARILADGRTLGEISLQGSDAELALFDRDLGPGQHRVEILTTQEGPVRLLGVALEASTGAVYSPLAFNGAEAFWMGDPPARLLVSQLQAEAPDLVLLAFGTNEANGRNFDRVAYQRRLEAFLLRFQRALPGTQLLLLGPPDARLPRALPGALEQVIAAQQAVAQRLGVLFLNQQEAMGGAGSIATWQQSGLAGRDGVHLTPQGYDRLAGLMLGHLFDRMGQPPPRTPHGVSGPFPQLARHHPEPPEVPEPGHAIFTFRTADGRTILTDRPSVVAGERGEWIGRKP